MSGTTTQTSDGATKSNATPEKVKMSIRDERHGTILEMIMKTVIATLVVALGLAAVALPASADYASPDASRLQQSLTHGY